jgi:hypothetical protein
MKLGPWRLFLGSLAAVGLAGWLSFEITASVTFEMVSMAVVGGVWGIVSFAAGDRDKWPDRSWVGDTVVEVLFGLAVGIPLLVMLSRLGMDEGTGPGGMNAGEMLALGLAVTAGAYSRLIPMKLTRKKGV